MKIFVITANSLASAAAIMELLHSDGSLDYVYDIIEASSGSTAASREPKSITF